MNSSIEHLLASFDQLTPSDQEVAAINIWRRLKQYDYNPTPEEALLEIANEGFLRLDAEEERIEKTEAG